MVSAVITSRAVLGRSDDVIVTGGENVQPFMVEEALRTIDGVEDVCVVGLDDDEWGQVVGAVCVVAPAVAGRDSFPSSSNAITWYS